MIAPVPLTRPSAPTGVRAGGDDAGTHAPQWLLDARICEQARRSRDPRFDGLFFTAVLRTRIYCRPVCPARAAERVVFFATAAGAEAAGYRPCLRCRPELSPADGLWRRSDDLVGRALALIGDGLLDAQPVATLAARLAISERQLRRLFVARLGVPPGAVNRTRRLLFAKQLLTETALPVTQVAMASGFRSLRRFNAAFRDAYRVAPRDVRRHPPAATSDVITLRLMARPPFAFDVLLAFWRARAISGVEVVDTGSYMRVIAPADGCASSSWMRLTAWPGERHVVRLELAGVPPARLPDMVRRARRMGDLDADPRVVAETLGASSSLAPLVKARPGLRLPGAWDGFEVAVRAIVGQQVSVVAARTIVTRLAQRYGARLASQPAPGLEWQFPEPETLADADLESIGLTRARAHAIRTMARAIIHGQVDFAAGQRLDEFVARWTSLPGIGPWTAHYLALRALGHPDAFPAGDLVLRRAAARGGAALAEGALLAMAEAWRPWRAYAAAHLWVGAAHSPPHRRPPALERTDYRVERVTPLASVAR